MNKIKTCLPIIILALLFPLSAQEKTTETPIQFTEQDINPEGTSRDENLLFYLQNGNTNQQNQALKFLLEGDIEKNATEIEFYFLTKKKRELMGVLLFRYVGISQYIIKRKKAALPFISKLKEKFNYEITEAAKSDTARDYNREYGKDKNGETLIKDHEIQNKLKEALEVLTELTEGKDPRKIIDEILEGKDNRVILSHRLISHLTGQNHDEIVSIFLYGALKTNNKYLKKNFISQLPCILDSFKREIIKKESPIIEKNAAEWKKLLADKTEYITENGEHISISDSSAIAIESIYGTTSRVTILWRKKALRKRIDKLLLKRADERLSGKTEEELTPYPQIKELAKENKTKLADRLEKAIKDKKIDEFIKSISDNEFVSLQDILSENSSLNDRIKSYANRVVRVECPNKVLDKFQDTILDKAGVEKIQEYCIQLAISEKVFVCIINREHILEGVSIVLIDSEDEINEILPISFRKRTQIPLEGSFMSGILLSMFPTPMMKWNINNIKNNKTGTDGKKICLKENDDNKWDESLGKIFGKQSICSRGFNICYTYIREDETQKNRQSPEYRHQ